MQHIDVYEVSDNGNVKHQRGGASMEMPVRPLHYRTHLFELTLPDKQTTHLYIRFAGESSKNLPVRIYRADNFFEISSSQIYALGAYYGLLLGLIIYNAFIYFAVRENSYLHYVMFELSFVAVTLSLNGLASQYVFPSLPTIAIRMAPVSICLLAFFSASFAYIFMGVSKSNTAMKKIMVSMMWISGIAAIFASFGNYHVVVIIAAVMAVIYSLILLTISGILSLRGNREARLFLLAWIALLGGNILIALRNLGVVPSHWTSEYGMLIGSAIEGMLLSIALASRMKSMREETDIAQAAYISAQERLVDSQTRIVEAQRESIKSKKEALELQQKYSARLEEEVKSRTTELMETQQRLVATEKMAALGVFTAGMAHEINNPANFISAGAQNAEAHIEEFRDFLKEILADEDDPEIRQAFDLRLSRLEKSTHIVREGVARIERVIKQLRSENPEGNVGMQPADVTSSLESAWRVLSPTIKIPIRIDAYLDARPYVTCIIADIHQVFLALLTNAVHAIEDRAGTISEAPQEGIITLTSQITEGGLAIRVGDNGIGIATPLLDKIFDPFFTTKTVGRGAGLGLSMARDVAKKHGGTLDVTSEPGRGSIFTLTLPLEGPDNRVLLA